VNCLAGSPLTPSPPCQGEIDDRDHAMVGIPGGNKVNQKDAVLWFQEVSDLGERLRRENNDNFNQVDVAKWVGDATSALHAVFPPNHALLQRWDATLSEYVGAKSISMNYVRVVDTIKGTFSAAHDQLKKGRLSSFVEGIRAETVGDLLDQANDLAEQNFLTAATVVAGGALETFLHFTCDRNNLTWQGHGSIEKYKNALAQARTGGNEIISASDEKQVTAWGGFRNDAAHKPVEFQRSVDSVRLMIDGVRLFINKYTA
jgi:hypothetical protein